MHSITLMHHLILQRLAVMKFCFVSGYVFNGKENGVYTS